MTDQELFARHPDLVEAFERSFYGPETNLEKLRALWESVAAIAGCGQTI